MGNRTILQKYEILDTLFTNDLQTVYIARDTSNEALGQLILNEFKDADIIYSMKDSFSPEKSRYLKNLVESFYVDFNFYIAAKICPGATLESFLSNNSLRLTEKMYITESLLTQLVEIDHLSPILKYALLNHNNISVVGKKNICFNCNLQFEKEDIAVTASDVFRRTGELLCAIFANTVEADIETDRDNLPPAVVPIIKKCSDGQYKLASELYNDFKALLLHSIFINNMSVDNQIRKNIKKANRRRKLGPVKRIAAAVLVIAMLGGLWTLADRYLLHKNAGVVNIIQQANTKPTAKFTASKNKVYEGDRVTFVDQSTDPDIDDSIKAYKWSVSQDGNLISSAAGQNFEYQFDKAGKYTVSLSVTDSKDAVSDDFQYALEVLAKQQIPAGSNNSNNNPNLVK